jgi:carboxyl-terminal processing protease
MSLSLEGIGAVLQMDDDYTVINSMVAGGPASKSKAISVGDRIVGLDKPARTWSMSSAGVSMTWLR